MSKLHSKGAVNVHCTENLQRMQERRMVDMIRVLSWGDCYMISSGGHNPLADLHIHTVHIGFCIKV